MPDEPEMAPRRDHVSHNRRVNPQAAEMAAWRAKGLALMQERSVREFEERYRGHGPWSDDDRSGDREPRNPRDPLPTLSAEADLPE